MTTSVAHAIPEAHAVPHYSLPQSSDAAVDLAKLIASACQDAKAYDLVTLDVSNSDLCFAEYFMVVSARSDRHAQGISYRVLEALAEAGIEPTSIEGLEKSHWVLIDCGDVVLHVFYEPARAHYNIESLWAKSKRVAVENW
jgi:ribosome-associated protein